MRLKIVMPKEVLIDEDIRKVVVEAANGLFGILPRHIDFVAALVPGIVRFTDLSGRERYVGSDDGLLVKCGEEVMIATPSAVVGDSLSTLKVTVRERYVELDERQRAARGALARLEAGVVRRFLELQAAG